MEFILKNWAELLLALITLAGTVTALTETETDDKWYDVAKRILNAVLLGKAKK
jgi:hypothetical protein